MCNIATETQTNLITLENGIARIEGFLIKGSIPNRTNNPGDIRKGPFTDAHGGIKGKSEKGFAVFPDPATGFRALRALLLSGAYDTLTIRQAITKYAPPTENDTEAYIRSICKWCGVSETDKVGEVLNRQYA